MNGPEPVRPSAPSSTAHITIPFHDLDPMQIVWHGNYLKYLEIARQALFDARGLDLYRHAGEHGFVFPVTKTSCKHVRMLRFRDEIAVTATVVEARHRIVLDYVLTLEPVGAVVARARTEQAAVKLPGLELQLFIPPDVQHALGGPHLSSHHPSHPRLTTQDAGSQRDLSRVPEGGEVMEKEQTQIGPALTKE